MSELRKLANENRGGKYIFLRNKLYEVFSHPAKIWRDVILFRGYYPEKTLAQAIKIWEADFTPAPEAENE